MNISLSTRQAYSEVDSFLELLDDEDKNKIPNKLRELFKNEKDKEYVKNIDVNKTIEEQNLKEETLALIALLNLKYWCEDESEKERLKNIYLKNEEMYQKELKEKYNTDNLFKNNKQIENRKVEQNQTTIIEYKESKLKKIINKIKKIFHIH